MVNLWFMKLENLMLVEVSHIDNIFETSELYLACNYCKRGYFRWGKISRKCWQDISLGGNFRDTTPISFINAYGFYFFAWG